MQALKESVPKSGIEKALASASSSDADDTFDVEVMGPGGSALIVQTTIDRKLGRMCKEIADLRKLAEKNGGKVASENSIAYMFEAKGAVVVNHNQEETEKFADADPEEIAIEIGAEASPKLCPSHQRVQLPRIREALCPERAAQVWEVCGPPVDRHRQDHGPRAADLRAEHADRTCVQRIHEDAPRCGRRGLIDDQSVHRRHHATQSH